MSIHNLRYWDKLKQAPQNFLRPIEYGALKGKSDINPQWRLMAMTQAFGVIGHGWTYRIIRTWSEVGADGQIMCFVEVAVKTKIDGEWGEEFWGIGGSTICALAKGNLKSNDEGYKMATTDALSVAFKSVGIASDIYLGNYDGSKYLFNIEQAYTEHSQKPKPKLTDEQFERAIQALQSTGKDSKGNPISKETIKHDYALTDSQLAQLLHS